MERCIQLVGEEELFIIIHYFEIFPLELGEKVQLVMSLVAWNPGVATNSIFFCFLFVKTH